jgi:uncharacterized protein (TIGR02646 family)
VIRIERPNVGAAAAARAELAAIEAVELARVRPLAAARAAAGGRLRSDDFGKRYNEVKRALAAAQFGKCCYCEKTIEASQNDAEHFRPKSRARRGHDFPDDGYWWLAWHWDNLMFACANCNRDGKGDQFPLDPASTCLAVGDLPPGGERPVLIDPLRDSPIEHIQFRPGPARVGSRPEPGRWAPMARNGSPRGQETIRRLKLDRPELLDQYKRHVIKEVIPELKKLREAEADDRTFAYQWRSTLRALLSPGEPFKALSYDVLVAQASRDKRAALRLDVPLPPYRSEGA